MGAIATAGPGATLAGLAWAITGDGNDYGLIKFERDPRTLWEGDTVNIMPLLRKAARERVEVPAAEARLVATPDQIARARSKHWMIHEDRNEAEALPGATL